ncbi:MAG: DUF4381 family protein [Candidatus Eisenbacteria bacterium]|uniref:DUF4381 family protein n=1 Tax=Eiseniibacteriota bacterium TaxID=2212470 RepID=A0A933SAC9_UNCEI|nr:DUF4381 family protein [Candidatus Eisenbacteria bacterium]
MSTLLALAISTLLGLFPPGHADKVEAGRHDTVRVGMPDSLRRGSRASVALVRRFPARTMVAPAPAKLGQQLVFRAAVIVPAEAKVQFEVPEPGGDFTWGKPVASKRRLVYGAHLDLYGEWADSVSVEIPLQVFATGQVVVPGVGVSIDQTKRGGQKLRLRTPAVRLLVLPTVTAADSAQGLKPVRGPLGAPWWEQVPWTLVFLGVLALAALAFAFRWWRSRARRPASAAPAAAARAPVHDPSAEALAELAKLRARRLPEAGLFGEHSVALTRILRRYLEATLGSPRPGDTSTELLARLGGGQLDPSDLVRLELLLSLWDRVKFARAPLDRSEAERCESAVEALVRRGPGRKEVA